MKVDRVSQEEMLAVLQAVSDALEAAVEQARLANGDAAAMRLEGMQIVALGTLWNLRHGKQDPEIAASLVRSVKTLVALLAVDSVVVNVPAGNA